MVQRVPTPVSIHLRPATELAERVLLPGDPHRALAVAQELMVKPRMFNHQRGLWGYTGEAGDGELLTVQATGMGGPSAAIVVKELIDLGAHTLVRIGTCGGLVPELALGELLTATAVVPADGASAALGARGRLLPDGALTTALLGSAPRSRPSTIVSSDLFYDERPGLAARWRAAGATAVEMEAATIFQVAARAGVRAGCALAVSDQLSGGPRRRRRISGAALEAAGRSLGRLAFDALVGLGEPGRRVSREPTTR